MRTKFGNDINNYIEYTRKLVRRDWDNMQLFTGPERSGKSTWAIQVLHAQDPKGFPGPVPDVPRIQFTYDAFLDTATRCPRFGAVLWDEGRLNKRRAMHGSTIAVLDFMQDSGGLNLHYGICFPHERLLDDAVKDHRVRYRHHVMRRGLVALYERREVGRRGAPGFEWVATGDRFSYTDNRGPVHAAYLVRKEEHMRSKRDVSSGAAGGVDGERLRHVWQGIKADKAV